MSGIQENYEGSPTLNGSSQLPLLSSSASKGHLNTNSLHSRNSRSGLVAVPENFTKNLQGLPDRLGNLHFKKAGKENEGQIDFSLESKDSTSLKGISRSPEKNGMKEAKIQGIQKTEASNSEFQTWNTHKKLTSNEMEKITKPSVKRLVNVCQIFFLDHYFDKLRYLCERQQRIEKFHEWARKQIEEGKLTASEYTAAWKCHCHTERSTLRKRRAKMKQENFHIIAQIGQGGYGSVHLAQMKDTKEIVALKKMSKKLLHKLDEIRHVLTERDILTNSTSPWLVRLLYAFQDPDYLFFAMEYVPGGDFRSLLCNSGILRDEHAKFYLSEMFMSVDSLHRLGYIHRDLKPENFLIDSKGHIKLTDFGLASGIINSQKIESLRLKLDQIKDLEVPTRTAVERRNIHRTLKMQELNYANSIVGSPDYMAPEILNGHDYDFTVDYWSLGCILFECLTGYPPFSGKNMNETWSNLKNWKYTLVRPVYEEKEFNIHDDAWEIITKLITNPRRRISSIQEVKEQKYFKHIDWTTLRQQEAPFVPDLDSEFDHGYFDDFTNENDMLKYKEVYEKQSSVESMEDRLEKVPPTTFVGFTYKHQKIIESNHIQDIPTSVDKLRNREVTFETLF
ncbi:hypothetical protein PNEG_00584 [Pneumocystis murina B123]|uniref:non-specific serine/threonine protein kinase n=1 Tax=Pneumocystis murina (strain B123) TaxID=1069680 RepID=M7NV28_PNEMU|nr:hypothetical protein PNEG_00584 [Pneumocystis murina B123]EMR10981.1 hypothetical protein PNEG_00584 [Pneumocystis murina B123]